MANFKSKVKNFWEDHKTDICIVGGIAAVSIGAGVWAYKCYMNGFMFGAAAGAHVMMDWLDETFPEESKARALYEAYANAHPEEIVWVHSSGKVVKN